MSGEVVRRARCSARCKIGGTGANHATRRTEAYRNQAAIRQCTDAQPEVDLLLKQALHAIGKEQTRLDIRVGLEEIRQDRDEVSAAKPDRGSQDQLSGRSGVFAGGGAL